MNMRRYFFLFCFFFLGSSVLVFAQGKQVDGELLVHFEDKVDVVSFLQQFAGNKRQAAPAELNYGRPVGQILNIHILTYNPRETEGQVLLERLRRHPQVEAAQFNYYLEWRGEVQPNDPSYDLQWTLPRIGLPEVWEVTTGGRTADDREVVVAVLDSGFDIFHEDLKDNLWINYSEVPGDGVDNDFNGYVDDVEGWNFINSSPEHPVKQHGHSVAGIIGARGNNDLGVSGVNWNVRLMLLSVSQVDQIVAAYEYALSQRELFLKTEGREGALVVVTNASFGVSRVFCEEQPVWGGMYDLLGKEGVLSVGGADNSAWDVDEVGDMPTTCPSDYLLTVLNTNIDDERHQGSAWGSESIDMGAPGQNSYTTKPYDEYGLFTGNSASVPHLTGSVALLYSLPCSSIAEGIFSQPEETALFIREVLLDGVDPLEDLDTVTVTGGRLNVFNSMMLIQEQCGGSSGPLSIFNLYPNPANEQVTVNYETPDFENYQIRVFNTLGQEVHRDEIVPSRFSEKSYELMTARYPTGLYYFIIHRGDERTAAPFVIQR